MNYLLATYSNSTDTGQGLVGALIIFLMVCFCLVIWLIPALVASIRHHHNLGAIWCLTIFLGWTFIGWVIALVWAFTNAPVQSSPIVVSNNTFPAPPAEKL
jgi:hypothetical protein